MPWVFMTTRKSTWEPLRAASARGWSTALGSGPVRAAAVPGAFAKAWATATERCRASRSESVLDWSTRAAMAAATSKTTIATCRRKT